MPIQFTQSQSAEVVLLELAVQTHYLADTLLLRLVEVKVVMAAWLVNLAALVAAAMAQVLFNQVVPPHRVKAMRAVTAIQLLVVAEVVLAQ
jgi:hypothetical protein